MEHGPSRWAELVAPWSCLVAVLSLAGCHWPAVLLGLGCALNALLAARPLDALRAARLRAAPRVAASSGPCLLHSLLSDDAFCSLLAHLDARDLETVACVDRRCLRLSRDDSVWRAAVARAFYSAAHDHPLAHMPSAALRAPPTGAAPLAELCGALALLRPSPNWWARRARAEPPVADGAALGSAPAAPPPLDARLLAASGRLRALAEPALGGHGEWRTFHYLLVATWRRLVVAPHHSASDCWIVVGERVCDVSAFLHKHPGEAGPLLLFAGLDGTEAFEATGHSFAAHYFADLEVPRLQRPSGGWPRAVRDAWRGSAPSGAAVSAKASSGACARAPSGRHAAAVEEEGGRERRALPRAAASPALSGHRALAVGRAALACALACRERLLAPGPQTFGFHAWADDSAGRVLSYHDFLDLRGRSTGEIGRMSAAHGGRHALA